LTTVPEDIGKLTNLTKLDLSKNNLTTVPEDIGKLTNLTNLDLSRNKLTTVPEDIGKLTNLTNLDLSRNKLTKVPEDIGKLNKLIKLDLSRNKLIKVPKDIGKLTNLIVLHLSGNQLTTVPVAIGKLTDLIMLNLSNNNLTIVPVAIGKLTNLIRLHLHNNKLTTAPEDIGKLNKLTMLNLSNNPLETPPIEIANKGVKAIRNYYEAMKAAKETVRLYEAKLLIVGAGDVGKTCLMKKLINPEKEINLNEISTEGIDIEKWIISTKKTNSFRINFWDFGGQEILHATHQFFLTKRSLYLFVWDSRPDDQLTSFDYWFNIIKLLSENSPVISILNKIDKNRPIKIEEKSLQEKFNIVSFHKVSAVSGKGIDYLLDLIKNEIDKLPLIGTELPKVWLDIREQLENSEQEYISYDEYKQICKDSGLNDKEADFLRDYYHDLGVFLNFKDNNLLKKIVFLKSEWATDAVYILVDNREIMDNSGLFSFADLKKDNYWKNKYPEQMFDYLLELMINFELCFKVQHNRYVIPELLEADKPKISWNEKDNLKFEYQYKFMPSGIITRFIARNHLLVKNNTYWRNGVVLKSDNTEALIISDPLEKRIKIWVKGNNKRELLAFIRNDIYLIHETLRFPEHQGLIPCVCEECKFNLEPYLWDVKTLNKALDKGRKSIQCQQSFDDVYIENILSNTNTTYDKVVRYLKHNKGEIADILGRFAGGMLNS